MDQMMNTPTEIERRKFFAWSDLLDHDVLRPLSHIRRNWEVRWDTGEQKYAPEEVSFAHALNELIDCIATSERPERYHGNEDVVAKYLAAHPNSKNLERRKSLDRRGVYHHPSGRGARRH